MDSTYTSGIFHTPSVLCFLSDNIVFVQRNEVVRTPVVSSHRVVLWSQKVACNYCACLQDLPLCPYQIATRVTSGTYGLTEQ